MRRALVAIAVGLVVGAVIPPLACASGAPASRIRGVVLNTTCPGPCLQPPPPPPRYTGPGLTVRVKDVRTGAVAATRHPTDGRFSVRVRPGRYRVHAWIGGGCWRGSVEPVRVIRGEIASVRLTVDNACIV